MRRARLDAGLSLAQVAGSELTRQAVHAFETGKKKPSFRSLQIIARRLGIQIGSLLTGPERDRLAVDDTAIKELDELDQARDHVRVVDRARSLIDWGGSPRLLAFAHFYLGQALCNLARGEEALDHLREAQAGFELLDNAWVVAECMTWQSVALYIQDDPTALDVSQEALRRYRLLDPRDMETEARMLENIGTILQRRQDFVRAREYYDEALQMAGDLHDLVRAGRRYHGLAICHIGLGDRRRAAELLMTAKRLYEAQHQISRVPSRILLPAVENDLGMLLTELGDLDGAATHLQSALGHFEEAGIDRWKSQVLLSLGELRWRQGQTREAIALTEQAMSEAEGTNQPSALAAAFKQLGLLHASLGEHAIADTRFRTALDVCKRAGLAERYELYLRDYRRVKDDRSQRRTGSERTGA